MIYKHLDLFSGIGGFALAARMVGGIETVAFCETDDFARRVLNKNFPGVPVFGDVREFNAKPLNGTIDLITGGYPCQPYSTSGLKRGNGDDRALWPQMRRIIDECRPRLVLGENVVGHIRLGLDGVLDDLESLGYTVAPPVVFPALALGAPHKRNRVWFAGFANTDGERRRGGAPRFEDATNARQSSRCAEFRQWGVEPDVHRVVDGLPGRVDRLRGIGNAIVPQLAAVLISKMFEVTQ